MRRRYAYALVLAACVVPRLLVLLHERAGLLVDIEKSDRLARVFLASGTFGYVPGEPTANTQPLYGWFLIAVYWVLGRHWWSFSSVQVAVAAATALVVYEIGRRHLSPRAGLIAALASTLQPYLVWHDVHGNREILDQLVGAGLFGLVLVARGPALGAAVGLVAGVSILSNARLVALPLLLMLFLRWRGAAWLTVLAVPVLTVVALAPWVVRTRVELGCWGVTTDARALWKANNLGTYATLRSGGWIDNVPDIPQRSPSPRPGPWYTPQEAGDYYANNGVKVEVDECAQQAHYEHLVWVFWRDHPGAKAKLMAQATWMLWSPTLGQENRPTGFGGLRDWVEPLYVVPLYLLALAGLAAVPRSLRVLAVLFVVYNTLAAWVFAGTTRYRVPFDFVLALLAAAAIDRLLGSWAPFRRPSSQNR